MKSTDNRIFIKLMRLCTSIQSFEAAWCMYVIPNTVVVYGVMNTGECIRQYRQKYVEAY